MTDGSPTSDPATLLSVCREASTTLSPNRSTVLTFDREGRMSYYFRDGRYLYKRSLANEVHLRYRNGQKRRSRLADPEGLEVLREGYEAARQELERAPEELRRRLDEEILRWTPGMLQEERRRFLEVYKPVSILPPDQYLSVVLQATEGCTWNRCSFCSFYMDRPFRVKSTEEFERHVIAVKNFLGKGLEMRRGIFIGDGNALALSQRNLESCFEIARSLLPGRAIVGFVDLYTGERRDAAEWNRLRQMGLERVYVGMETGLDELLSFVNKPGTSDELVDFVEALKTAEIGITLIVMVGLGGVSYRQRHARASLETIGAMNLGKMDQIYLSPFVDTPGSDYSKRSAAVGLEPMTEAEIEAELEDLSRELRSRGLRVSRYDIREFVY
jgi:radical SAM superfamily enzyme YgiQ (UPF0313 family)